MMLIPEPVLPDSPLVFKLRGFPEETLVKNAVEQYYFGKADSDRNFSINNSFNELIFSGAVGGDGKVLSFKAIDRPRDSFSKPAI